jgi:hypothetical protein
MNDLSDSLARFFSRVMPPPAAATQSFLNTGFCSAAQVELVVMIGHKVFTRYKGGGVAEFQEFLFLHNCFLSPICWLTTILW